MIGKISLGLNALLVVAVVYLFTQISRAEEQADPGHSHEVSPSIPSEGSSVAYILEDSLLVWCDKSREESELFQDKQYQAQLKLMNKQKKLEEETYKWQNYLMEHPEMQEQAYQELGALEQEMMRLQQKMESDHIAFNQKLIGEIREYVVDYSAENGLDFVLNTSSLTPIFWHSNESRDITRAIADGMNAEYALESVE